MIRNLLIISGAGLILAVVGIGGSFAVGGRDLARHDWTWEVTDNDGNDGFKIERGAVSPEVTRTLAWTGDQRLAIDLTADITYDQQAGEPGVTIIGPKTVVDRVRFANGRLTMEGAPRGDHGYIRWTRIGIQGWSETDALKVVIKAPSVKAFDLSGHTQLNIRGYDQPTLDLTLTGASDVKAQGRAEAVTLDISGAGSAALEELFVTDAKLRVSGSGDAEVGPTGKAEIDVSGSGSVRLTRRPAQLRQDISGSGDVTQD
ncbi:MULTISPECIES: GIN domain-containing protein [unclassified Brevundimonas]|uniref:GIN domain-containing protein n=1 Tax=unclassified Brevundimonas TaxID=2622653 RepID=UPI003F92EDF1